ncbi:DUF4180 domain-containing protein [Niabella beijingensis]|uniref:DUF4180 domain-containing protein n=1 Tax=Niabella beijingensis TaxID=2872700 RepID=UPI001CBAFBC0|nr:DUF4180 domain-containing protein [Niabella beijingensis]MBZ4189098.1 DUF4180 domain-containing protein [Niabella beijingensis]
MESTAHIMDRQTIVEDAVDRIGSLYYQGYDSIMLQTVNIIPQFSDLNTKLAGEILQQFINDRMCVTIVGNRKTTVSESCCYYCLPGGVVIL